MKQQRGKGRRRCRTTMATWLLALAVALPGCGSDETGTTAVDTTSGGTAAFGAPCAVDGDCKAGLTCIGGDWGPKPFCGRVCTEPKTYCDADLTGGPQGFCIQLGDDFQGSERTFCVPMCQQTAECKAISGIWQSCGVPTWKNVKLAPELPTKVCQAPDTQGQVVVDPVTCDWEGLITDPQFQSAKQTCKTFCTFLKTCKFWDTKTSPLTCCSWNCFQEMTPGGAVSAPVEACKKCQINANGSVANTAKVCDTGYYDDKCGTACGGDTAHQGP